MKHRKSKEMAQVRREEAVDAVEAVVEILRETEGRLGDSDVDVKRRIELAKMRREMEESLPQLRAAAYLPSPSFSTTIAGEDEDGSEPTKRQDDLTSASSQIDPNMVSRHPVNLRPS
jgi:DNA polymerase gamma 1